MILSLKYDRKTHCEDALNEKSWQPANTATSYTVCWCTEHIVGSRASICQAEIRRGASERRHNTESRHGAATLVLYLTGMMSQLRIWVGMTMGGVRYRGFYLWTSLSFKNHLSVLQRAEICQTRKCKQKWRTKVSFVKEKPIKCTFPFRNKPVV